MNAIIYDLVQKTEDFATVDFGENSLVIVQNLVKTQIPYAAIIDFKKNATTQPTVYFVKANGENGDTQSFYFSVEDSGYFEYTFNHGFVQSVYSKSATITTEAVKDTIKTKRTIILILICAIVVAVIAGVCVAISQYLQQEETTTQYPQASTTEYIGVTGDSTTQSTTDSTTESTTEESTSQTTEESTTSSTTLSKADYKAEVDAENKRHATAVDKITASYATKISQKEKERDTYQANAQSYLQKTNSIQAEIDDLNNQLDSLNQNPTENADSIAVIEAKITEKTKEHATANSNYSENIVAADKCSSEITKLENQRESDYASEEYTHNSNLKKIDQKYAV